MAKTRDQLEGTVNASHVTKIRGLDSSIVIDSRRFHLTLGVMALEDESTEEGVADWMDENTDRKDAEGMQLADTRPWCSTTSVEDTRSPLGRVSPKPSSQSPNAISNDISAVKSTSAYIPLNSQSQSHQGSTICTTDDVLSPTHTTLQISSDSNWTPSTSSSFPTAQTYSIPNGPRPSSAITFTKHKTVKSALDLLCSLKPQIDNILGVPAPDTGYADTTVKEICENTEVDIDQRIIPSRNQDTLAINTNIKRKGVLNVTLNKMDIMQKVAPPKLKVKGKEKQQKNGDALGGSSTTLGLEALSEVNSVDMTGGGELTLFKQENVDRSVTLVSPPAGDCAENGSVSSLTTSSTNGRCKLPTPLDKTNDVWANIMYLAPREEDEEGRKLRQVCGMFLSYCPFCPPVSANSCLLDLVHTTFKLAGYVTEARPLKVMGLPVSSFCQWYYSLVPFISIL